MTKNKTVEKILDSIDIYGARPNSFTIKGREKIYSNVGVFCSILQFLIIAVLLGIKLTFVVIKHNPNISVFD